MSGKQFQSFILTYHPSTRVEVVWSNLVTQFKGDEEKLGDGATQKPTKMYIAKLLIS